MKSDFGNLGADLARLKKADRRNGDRQEEPKRRTRRAPDNKAQAANLLNARRLLQSCEDLDGLVSFDEFASEIILEKRIPRPDFPSQGEWQPRPFQDEDATALAEVLLERKLLKASSGLVYEVVRGIAKDVSKHPVRDYLRGLEWDGTERLSNWLKDFAGATCQDPDNPEDENRVNYIEAVSRAALIGAAARVLKPGCKHDHSLVLIGAQGIGKSRLLRALVPDPTWFSDSLTRDLGDKDAVLGLAGVWIAELAELASLNRTDFAQAKAFLSRQVDKFRPPYGRSDIKQARQVAFFATTNVAEPFKDESNRRFWPIDCTRCDPDGLAGARDQLWAEAVRFFNEGEPWWLSRDMEAVAQGEQARRLSAHPLIGPIREVIGTLEVIEIKMILQVWDVRKTDWSRVTQDVSRALREMGWRSARRLENGVRTPRWYAPGTQWEPPS